MNPLSLCQLTIETEETMRQTIAAQAIGLIDAAQAAGFDAIVPRLRDPAGLGTKTRRVGGAQDVRLIRERLDDSGLAVPSIVSFWLTPDTKADDFTEAVDAAAAIRAKSIQVVCHDLERQRALETFARSCELAASRGLGVALEFMAYSSVRTLSDVRQFIKSSGQPNAGICLDALHLSRSGGSPDDVRSLAGAELSLVQICDAPAQIPLPENLRTEARTGRLYPGQGSLWLGALIDALPAGCLLDVEAPCLQDVGLSSLERRGLRLPPRGNSSRHMLQAVALEALNRG